ncbi:serine/threonine-protein kinase [Nocardia sp. CNY236]|uniref:serine/threonine-protein kinase n=1 Tax=Nocardia sp. CNY236 TaxID=1169152 RepID=UPI0004079986|nr:serine/threonine-protein kinase [Nocardia sp. CNY236]
MTSWDPFATQHDRPSGIEQELEGEGFDDPEIVGKGGFGVVYRCRQRSLNRSVAVKVLTARFDLEVENIERFVREQQAMGALSGHPNIVPILQVGTTRGGSPYLVMPYHSHGSLDHRIRRDGVLPAPEAIDVAIKLAGALETAHRTGILHRDIKPGNVLFTDYGEPQLADFGIARIEGGFETTTGVVTGSPAFTAPEVLHSGIPSVASDVYGLGATLFAMITGHAAYERRSGEQIVAQFLRISADPLPDLRPDGIPNDICAVIEAGMSRSPADRPPSAAAFGELLRNIQRHNGVSIANMTLPSDNQPAADEPGPRTFGTTPHSPSLRYGTPRSLDTKFRPAVPTRRLVQRDRLIGALQTEPRPQLAVIHAPAGFGKSTLAAQWTRQLAETEGVLVVWMNADRDDNNVVWLLTHLVEAFNRADPTLAPELTPMLEEGDSDARETLTTLVDSVLARGQRFALVIDDWDRVIDPPAVSALNFLVDQSCPDLQIILTGRSLGGLPLGTMRVQHDLVEIDSTALRFDDDEARAFLAGHSGVRLDDEDSARLRDCTEGWAAALQLASLSLREHPDPTTLIRHLSGRHHTITEYLAENVLDTVEPDVLELMLETSLPEQISGNLATALTGIPQGQTLLENLERRNLFLHRTDDGGEWFRYHHLFADFLRQRLERDRPEQVVELHRAAAAWFADHGMLSEAIDHALACGDREYAVDIIEAKARDLVQDAQLATLLGLVGKLPPEDTGARPLLQIEVAWSNVLLRRPSELHAALRLVRAAISTSPDADSDLAVEADLIECVEGAFADHVDGVDAVVDECMARADTLVPWTLCTAANLGAFSAVYRFDYHAACEWHDWAAQYHPETHNTFILMYSECLVGMAAREQLDVPAAERSFRTAVEIATRSSGPKSYAARLAGVMLGELLYDRDHLAAAERLLDDAGPVGTEGGPVEFLMATYATGARIKALRGDLPAAARRLEEGAEAAQAMKLPRLAARIANEQIRLGLRPTYYTTEPPVGDSGIAMVTAELCADSAIRTLLRSDSDDAYSAACVRARHLRDSIDAAGRPRAAVHAQLLVTTCLAAAGQTDAAKGALVPVISTCADTGLVRPLLDDSPWIGPLLRELEDDQRQGRWHAEWPIVPVTFLHLLANCE